MGAEKRDSWSCFGMPQMHREDIPEDVDEVANSEHHIGSTFGFSRNRFDGLMAKLEKAHADTSLMQNIQVKRPVNTLRNRFGPALRRSPRCGDLTNFHQW